MLQEGVSHGGVQLLLLDEGVRERHDVGVASDSSRQGGWYQGVTDWAGCGGRPECWMKERKNERKKEKNERQPEIHYCPLKNKCEA